MYKQIVQKSIDICILDFDDCLYPGISKVDVYFCIAREISFSPGHIGDLSYLPHLGISAMRLLALRLRQQIKGDITDGQLVQMYQRIVAPIPSNHVKRASRIVSKRIYPGALETIAFMSSICSVGIISLAITDVLKAVNQRLQKKCSISLDFIYGNDLMPGKNSIPVLTADDKRRIMQLEIERLKCISPLVIGNDEEDLGMVTLARELGGISIGINTKPKIAGFFDYSVDSKDWYEVLSFLRELITPVEFRTNQ